MQTAKAETVTLVGAGLVGSLLAGFLARRGLRVELYERRPDMRQESISAGRSINLAVSVRGLHALAQLGLEREVLEQAVAMRGRMIHAVDGTLTFQRYGKDDSECIHSVSRGGLNRLLLTAAERTGQVALHFNERAVSYDGTELAFRHERTGTERRVRPECVIGTDGSASVVREAVLAHAGAQSHEVYLDYGYKELAIPAGPHGAFQLEKHALHIWPRGTYMLIALPNLDGSFTCTLFLPMEGPLSFAELHGPEQVRDLFSEQFPDVLALIEDLEGSFFSNPTGRMVTVKCAPWNDGGRALLVGDAAHAIVPFFGQGMNCGFEDCSVFDEMLTVAGGWPDEAKRAALFSHFGSRRKPDADAIADLAVENFVEMRDKVAQPRFLLEKAVERILQEKFPGQYVSRYGLVTFSRAPYSFALALGRAQNELLSELCAGLTRAEDVDLAWAERLIRTKLPALS